MTHETNKIPIKNYGVYENGKYTPLIDLNDFKDSSIAKHSNIIGSHIVIIDTQNTTNTHKCIINCPCKYNHQKRYNIFKECVMKNYTVGYSDSYPINTMVTSIHGKDKWIIYNLIYKKPPKCDMCNMMSLDTLYEFDIINDTRIYCSKCIKKTTDKEKVITYYGNNFYIFKLEINIPMKNRQDKLLPLYLKDCYITAHQYNSYFHFKSSMDIIFKRDFYRCFDSKSNLCCISVSYDDYYEKQKPIKKSQETQDFEEW
jgi:hypothetical protein